MLYLLTYADALATSFRAWNNWKSMLVRELFFKLLRILEAGDLGTGEVRWTPATARKLSVRWPRRCRARRPKRCWTACRRLTSSPWPRKPVPGTFG